MTKNQNNLTSSEREIDESPRDFSLCIAEQVVSGDEEEGVQHPGIHSRNCDIVLNVCC